jgi:hypothetical protein
MSDEMKPIAKATVKVTGASEGDHASKFRGAYAMPPNDKGWAPSMQLVFDCNSGEVATRICPQDVTKNNASGKLLAQMLGRPLQPKEEVDFGQFVGKLFVVRVELTESGNGTRITKITPQ